MDEPAEGAVGLFDVVGRRLIMFFCLFVLKKAGEEKVEYFPFFLSFFLSASGFSSFKTRKDNLLLPWRGGRASGRRRRCAAP